MRPQTQSAEGCPLLPARAAWPATLRSREAAPRAPECPLRACAAAWHAPRKWAKARAQSHVHARPPLCLCLCPCLGLCLCLCLCMRTCVCACACARVPVHVHVCLCTVHCACACAHAWAVCMCRPCATGTRRAGRTGPSSAPRAAPCACCSTWQARRSPMPWAGRAARWPCAPARRPLQLPRRPPGSASAPW